MRRGESQQVDKICGDKIRYRLFCNGLVTASIFINDNK
jgi:hypothetical protein